MKILMTALFALSAAGCTASSYMRDAEATSAPAAGEAKVIVYRTEVPGGVDNFAVTAVTEQGATLLGFTETDAYFEARLAPGLYAFVASGEGDAVVVRYLAAGETFALQAWSKFGLLSSRPGLAEGVRRDFDRLRCRELDPKSTDEAQSWALPRAQAAAGLPPAALLTQGGSK